MDKTPIRYMDFNGQDNLQKKLSFFGQRSSAGWVWVTACQSLTPHLSCSYRFLESQKEIGNRGMTKRT